MHAHVRCQFTFSLYSFMSPFMPTTEEIISTYLLLEREIFVLIGGDVC